MTTQIQTQVQKIQTAANRGMWEAVTQLGGKVIVSYKSDSGATDCDWRIEYQGWMIDPERVLEVNQFGGLTDAVLPLARPAN